MITVTLTEEQELSIVNQIMSKLHKEPEPLRNPVSERSKVAIHVRQMAPDTLFRTLVVAAQCNVDSDIVSSTLSTTLKKEGVVEMIHRGLWKRK